MHGLVKQTLHYMSFIASLSECKLSYITKRTVFNFILILTNGDEF